MKKRKKERKIIVPTPPKKLSLQSLLTCYYHFFVREHGIWLSSWKRMPRAHKVLGSSPAPHKSLKPLIPNTQKVEAGDFELQAGPSYMVSPYHKSKIKQSLSDKDHKEQKFCSRQGMRSSCSKPLTCKFSYKLCSKRQR